MKEYIIEPPLIAHVIYKLDVGGLENGLVNIINHLPKGRYRHAIICLTEHSDFYKKIHPDVELVELHKKPGKDIGLYWRLYKTLCALQPHIIHTRNLSALESQFIAWLSGVSSRVHGLHGWDSDEAKQNRTYLRLYKALDSLIHRYIPLSDELEMYLKEDVNVAGQKITKICNGVDTYKFIPNDNAKSVLPIKFVGADIAVIGTVGRMEQVKDQLNLVEAFIYLLKKHPELVNKARLVLIGSGSMERAIHQRIEQAGIQELVWLPGVREDVPDLMQAMDIFVLPSQAEGISNTILEAMASGLPVIATNVGGNAQLVVDDETGYIVPSKSPEIMSDALVKYLSNPEKRAIHSAAARERVLSHFSIKHMVNAYQQVYDSFSY